MGKKLEELEINGIRGIIFVPYINSEGYEINNVSKILVDDDKYIITSHGITTEFSQKNIQIQRIEDAS